MKKNPLSLQLNTDDFLPASEEEKQSLIIMRESVSFWKDSMRRLLKNKVAMVSLFFIILIMFFSFIVPSVTVTCESLMAVTFPYTVWPA